jgi:CheY-like chemotaxis protein
MPVIDGLEATRRIKATVQGQATVIIALTASAFEEDRSAVLAEGCDDFVRKPFREQEILDMLTKHLSVRFVYEDGVQEKEVAADALAPAALASLPVDWVAELVQAATQADSELILALAGQLPAEQESVADALTMLVHNFRFDTILALAEQARKQKMQ